MKLSKFQFKKGNKISKKFCLRNNFIAFVVYAHDCANSSIQSIQRLIEIVFFLRINSSQQFSRNYTQLYVIKIVFHEYHQFQSFPLKLRGRKHSLSWCTCAHKSRPYKLFCLQKCINIQYYTIFQYSLSILTMRRKFLTKLSRIFSFIAIFCDVTSLGHTSVVPSSLPHPLARDVIYGRPLNSIMVL